MKNKLPANRHKSTDFNIFGKMHHFILNCIFGFNAHSEFYKYQRNSCETFDFLSYQPIFFLFFFRFANRRGIFLRYNVSLNALNAHLTSYRNVEGSWVITIIIYRMECFYGFWHFQVLVYFQRFLTQNIWHFGFIEVEMIIGKTTRLCKLFHLIVWLSASTWNASF